MSWIHYDTHGFRENLVPISETDVVRSHDSIWHRSDEFYKPCKYQTIELQQVALSWFTSLMFGKTN